MPMPVLMASHDQGHVAPHFNQLDLGNAMMPLVSPDVDTNSNGIFCHQHWCQSCDMIKNVMLHLISIIMTYWIQWCYSWCFKHHVLPVASHDQKSHVVSHFNHLGLSNSVAAFTMPLALHDQEDMLHLISVVLTIKTDRKRKSFFRCPGK